jgi:hypothetical protein
MVRLIPALCLIALALLTGLAAMPARAQVAICAPLVDMLADLETVYGERRVMSALSSTGNMVILTAGESGTWTELSVEPNMIACMTGSGAAFTTHEPPAPGIEG